MQPPGNKMKTFRELFVLLPLIVISLVSIGCEQSVNLLRAADNPSDSTTENTRKESAQTLNNSPIIHPVRKKGAVSAEVVRVIDGSTIEVNAKGDQYIVSYIGIETPHFDHPVLGTEPFGKEAIERNRELVEGETVVLEKDRVEKDRDGNELRYVYVGDVMVNAVLVHEGLAQADAYSIGLKYNDLLNELQNQAIVDRKGGWRQEWGNVIPFR
jgi:micrococcal nuclease